jgi:hypothetical protein
MSFQFSHKFRRTFIAGLNHQIPSVSLQLNAEGMRLTK